MDFSVTLRDAQDSDAAIIAEYANDYEIAKMVSTMPHPYSIDDAHAFFTKIRKQQQEGKGHSPLIVKDGMVVGTVGWFYNEGDGLEIGYWIARKYWGQGIAANAVNLILDVIRQECPHETEVLAQYMDENPASGRVLEKCGFVKQGKSKSGCYSLARGQAEPAMRMLKKL